MAGIQNNLRFLRPHRPFGIELAGENLVRKISPHPRVLRRGVAGRPGIGARRTFHIGGDANFRVIHLERRFVAVQRMNEAGHAQPTVLAADVNPLLVGGEKTLVGTPHVAGATVTARIAIQNRDKKILVFKSKKRKGTRKLRGHRQYKTVLKIEKISA